MKPKDKKYLEAFNREAESSNPTTDWGRARRQERRYDIYNKATQVAVVDEVENLPILPENVRQINIQINPRAANWVDLVHDKVDKERGRNMGNDVEPGMVRVKGGYKVAFFPDKAFFKTEIAAREWLRNKQAVYAKTAR
jgi:hypothetical protein